MDQPANHEELPGIECVAGGARLVVASSAVDHVVELEVAPLPLARPFVTGMAIHDGEIVISVRADQAARPGAAAPSRATKAVLLARGEGAVRFAVEIDQVLSFVRARPIATGRAVCSDGREVAWLDPAWVARTLSGGASS
jgi:hypothetical protein